MITVLEEARSTRFTTLARLKGELGISLVDTTSDERLEAMIDQVSAMILSYCQRPFARSWVTERQPSFGTTTQSLSFTPIARLDEVRYNGEPLPLTTYEIYNPDAGQVYADGGWPDATAKSHWIEPDPVNMRSALTLAFDYIGGFLMPEDDFLASGICSADASDQSFNLDDDEVIWPMLVSGESVRISGFANAANNGRFRVHSRTEDKLIVTSALVTEPASGVVTIRARNLPRDLEAWALYELRLQWTTQDRDQTIVSERLGDWGATYVDPGAPDSRFNARENAGLSERTAMGLRPWIRVE